MEVSFSDGIQLASGFRRTEVLQVDLGDVVIKGHG
jgi:hypothetical protein